MAGRALISPGGGKDRIGSEAFTAPTSVVLGEVSWRRAQRLVPRGAAGRLRPIVLGADSNIQDNCTVHVGPGFPVTVGARVSVGHDAVLHGCTVEDDVLIGMGATVLNGARIGAGSLVAAQALAPPGHAGTARLPGRRPAKVKRELTDEERGPSASMPTMYRELAARHGRMPAPGTDPAAAGRHSARPAGARRVGTVGPAPWACTAAHRRPVNRTVPTGGRPRRRPASPHRRSGVHRRRAHPRRHSS